MSITIQDNIDTFHTRKKKEIIFVSFFSIRKFKKFSHVFRVVFDQKITLSLFLIDLNRFIPFKISFGISSRVLKVEEGVLTHPLCNVLF